VKYVRTMEESKNNSVLRRCLEVEATEMAARSSYVRKVPSSSVPLSCDQQPFKRAKHKSAGLDEKHVILSQKTDSKFENSISNIGLTVLNAHKTPLCFYIDAKLMCICRLLKFVDNDDIVAF